MNEIDRSVYLNAKQWELLNELKKRNVFVGGRGSGKSTIGGDYLYRCVDTMPRSSGALMGPTFEILYNRSLPAINEHWQRLGLEEDYDFVVGKKPPPEFEKPYTPPKDFRNVISFANGTVIHLISLYEKNAGRGLSIQFLLGDEMAFAKRERFTKNVMPAMRGHYYKQAKIELDEYEDVPFGSMKNMHGEWVWTIPFRENPYYMSFLLVTSMPFLEEGKWILKYEDDPAVKYLESTALDNEEVLGPEYVPNLRKELDDLEFRVEVMNERIEQLPDGFYPKFSDQVHTTMDDRYAVDQPIDVSFDFGNFNSMIVAQDQQAQGNIAAVIDTLYVKNGTVDDLVDKFISLYKQHKQKRINVYGDRNGNNSRPNNKQTLYQEIQLRLRKAGWIVSLHSRGLDPPHAHKHQVINAALQEDEDSQLPRIRMHQLKCKNLIFSIKLAPIKDGFKKDKRSEHPDNPTPQEKATHFSDCFDNWYYPKFHRKHRVRGMGAGIYH